MFIYAEINTVLKIFTMHRLKEKQQLYALNDITLEAEGYYSLRF